MANKNVKLKDGSDYLFPQTIVDNITDLTATAAELNVLDGITATTTELNYCDGVTSNIQTQLDAKQATLSTAQLNAANSGIDSSKVSTYDGYAATIAGKQDTLVSGTSIKTINGQTILGSGDMTISGDVSFNEIYNITVTTTNVTASSSNPTRIEGGSSVTLTFTANSEYVLPANVTVTGATGTWTQATGTMVLSNPTGAVSFSVIGESAIVYPTKGQKITMNLDGTNRYYRVLNVSGSNAEVVALFDATASQAFDSSGSSNVYAGSELDTYINTTWYGTLTSTAKTAIVDKTFTQDSWYWGDTGNPDYSGYYGTSNPGTTAYTVSLGSATYGSSITRHCYALSVQDVIDYVKDTSFGRDGELQNYNIWKMFWDDEVAHSGSYSWLRSADADDSYSAWYVSGSIGRVDSNLVGNGSAVRPALTIDLSKISWS